jgi:N-acetylglucosaminyldiphosphoundecaprenol N-acetyl-beta-D-mannosaminyltransferase
MTLDPYIPSSPARELPLIPQARTVERLPSPLPYETLFGLSFCKLTLEATVEEMGRRAESRQGSVVVTCNVDHVVLRARNAAFARAYSDADIVTADGAPLVAFSRLVRRALPGRVTGADIVASLPALAAARGLRVALVGGAPGVAEAAAQRLVDEAPGMPVPLAVAPSMGLQLGSQEDQAIIEQLQEYDPHVVVVCFGAPKQELWMHRHHGDLPGSVLVGGGAALDFVVGLQRRAPTWVQKAGCEWTWRLAHDFRRLARRYLVQDAGFVPIAARELVLVARESRQSG